MICTFFGRHDATDEIEQPLREAIQNVIAQGVTTFYIGHHGHFDGMAYRLVQEEKKTHPGLDCVVVLSNINRAADYPDTLYPEGIENTLPRFAIDFRNRYMLSHADYVITYTQYSFGNAAKYERQAQKMAEKGKIKLISLTI